MEDVKIKLSALWVAVALCELNQGIWGLHMPGSIEEIIAGEVTGIPITQEWLLGVVILMIIPSVMVFLSLILKPKANRWVNIILGIVYTGFMLFTMLLPEVWAHYIFLGIAEAVFTALIVWYAWKWK